MKFFIDGEETTAAEFQIFMSDSKKHHVVITSEADKESIVWWSNLESNT